MGDDGRYGWPPERPAPYRHATEDEAWRVAQDQALVHAHTCPAPGPRRADGAGDCVSRRQRARPRRKHRAGGDGRGRSAPAAVPSADSSAQPGNYVGTVTNRVYLWDAEEIDGTNNNADESDTNGWIPLTSSAYSYNGDLVCHDGAASYYAGHPTPCGIQVINQDITWQECYETHCYNTRGVEGSAASGWAATEGDSGATVFTISGTNSRQARGLVTSGASANATVFWTEAPDILSYFGLKLNPQT